MFITNFCILVLGIAASAISTTRYTSPIPSGALIMNNYDDLKKFVKKNPNTMLHKDSGGYVMKNWPAGQSLAWASDELCEEFDKDMEEMEAQEAMKESGTEEYEFTNKPMEYDL